MLTACQTRKSSVHLMQFKHNNHWLRSTTMVLSLCFTLTVAAASPAMALVNVPVACVRENPAHAAELGSQVVLGTPIEIGEPTGDWYPVITPEGYHGYIIANSIRPLSHSQYLQWKQCDRLFVKSFDQTYIYTSPHAAPGNRVCEAVNGSILRRDTAADTIPQFHAVLLPDGRKGYIATGDAQSLSSIATDTLDTSCMLHFAHRMLGSAYLWGGTSSKGVDCSGLTKAAFLSQGFILPRNASQQARTGMEISLQNPSLFRPGDLLFFGNAETRRVNHVGIYIGNSRFIHCSGWVRINSINPSSSDFIPLELLSVRRFDHNSLSSMAITAHPWYF